MLIFVISLLCALLVFLFAHLLLRAGQKKKEAVSERMQLYVGEGILGDEELRQSRKDRIREALQQHIQKTWTKETQTKLDLMMHRAGLPLLGHEFVFLSIGGAVLGFFIGMILFRQSGMALLVAAIVITAEWRYIQYLIKKRLQSFVFQMADCLTLIANSLRAGFSFLQTMEIISHEMKPPMSTEFERVLRETNLGKSLEQSLTAMDKRVGSPDFSLIVTAVLIQQQVGGNLAEIMDTIRETIMERIRIRREITALTAQGRMAGYVLACIPIFLGAFLTVIAPDQMNILFTSTLGRLAIGVAILLEIIGFIAIYKIVDIKI